jgi:hypothetical protein
MRPTAPSTSHLCICTKEPKLEPTNIYRAGFIRLRCRREP